MQAKEIMAHEPACCTRETSLREVAAMMVDHDCGVIPVVESHEDQRLVGVITDRDIVCRAVAAGKNPLEMNAGECMTDTVVAVAPDASLEECARIMEEHKIRRVPVIDGFGRCCGVVSQADLARHAPQGVTAEMVREI